MRRFPVMLFSLFLLPRQMWQSIDSLLGRGQQPPDAAISATDFQRFFDKKVVDIRASTCSAATRSTPSLTVHFQASLQFPLTTSMPQY